MRFLNLALAAAVPLSSFPAEAWSGPSQVQSPAEWERRLAALGNQFKEPDKVTPATLSSVDESIQRLHGELEANFTQEQKSRLEAELEHFQADFEAVRSIAACVPDPPMAAAPACLLEQLRQLVNKEEQAKPEPPASWLPFLESRYSRLLQTRFYDGDETAKARLERIGLVIAALKEIQRRGLPRDSASLMTALLNKELQQEDAAGAAGAANNLALKNLQEELVLLQKAARKTSGETGDDLRPLGRLFEDLKKRYVHDQAMLERISSAEEGVSAEAAAAPKEIPASYPKPGAKGLATGAVPAPLSPAGSQAAPAEARPAQPEGPALPYRFDLNDAVLAAASRFFKVDDLAFENRRLKNRQTLLELAKKAMTEWKIPFSAEASLEDVDALLVAKAQEAPYNWPKSAGGQEDMKRRLQGFFRQLGTKNPASSEYFAARLAYVGFLWDALSKDGASQIRDGARFEAWELGQDVAAGDGAKPVKSLVYHRLSEDEKTYSGFFKEYADGSKRFDGFTAAEGTQEGFTITVSPDGGTETRTAFTIGEDQAPAPQKSTIIDREKGRELRERVQDFAKKRASQIDFGEDERPVLIQTWDMAGGTTIVSDIKRGLRQVSDDKGNTTVFSTNKDSPWKWIEGTGAGKDFLKKKIVFKNGAVQEYAEKHVARGPNDGAVETYFVELDGLDKLEQGAGRDAAAKELAQEILRVLSKREARFNPENDDYVRPLANMLYDLDLFASWLSDLNKGGASLERLAFDARGNITLIFKRLNSTKEMLSAQFNGAHTSSAKGRPNEMALLLSRPVSLDDAYQPLERQVDERAGQDWFAYLASGGMNEWSQEDVPVDKWGSQWYRSREYVRHFVVKHYAARDAGGGFWDFQKFEKDELYDSGPLESEPSVLSRMFDLPVLKQCGKIASTGYHGAMGGIDNLLGEYHMALGLNDTGENYKLVAASHFANATYIREGMGDEGHVDRFTNASRQFAEANALKNREAALKKQGISPGTVTPETWQRYMSAPVTDRELVDAVAQNGTEAQMSFAIAKQSTGWEKGFFYAAGTDAVIADKAGTILFDPTTWAFIGLGAGLKAGKASIEAAKVAATTNDIVKGWGFIAPRFVPGTVKAMEVAHLGVSVPYLLPMAEGTAKGVAGAYESFVKKDYAGGIENTVEAVVNGAFLVSGGKDAYRSAKDLVRPVHPYGAQGRAGASKMPKASDATEGRGTAPEESGGKAGKAAVSPELAEIRRKIAAAESRMAEARESFDKAKEAAPKVRRRLGKKSVRTQAHEAKAAEIEAKRELTELRRAEASMLEGRASAATEAKVPAMEAPAVQADASISDATTRTRAVAPAGGATGAQARSAASGARASAKTLARVPAAEVRTPVAEARAPAAGTPTSIDHTAETAHAGADATAEIAGSQAPIAQTFIEPRAAAGATEPAEAGGKAGKAAVRPDLADIPRKIAAAKIKVAKAGKAFENAQKVAPEARRAKGKESVQEQTRRTRAALIEAKRELTNLRRAEAAVLEGRASALTEARAPEEPGAEAAASADHTASAAHSGADANAEIAARRASAAQPPIEPPAAATAASATAPAAVSAAGPDAVQSASVEPLSAEAPGSRDAASRSETATRARAAGTEARVPGTESSASAAQVADADAETAGQRASAAQSSIEPRSSGAEARTPEIESSASAEAERTTANSGDEPGNIKKTASRARRAKGKGRKSTKTAAKASDDTRSASSAQAADAATTGAGANTEITGRAPTAATPEQVQSASSAQDADAAPAGAGTNTEITRRVPPAATAGSEPAPAASEADTAGRTADAVQPEDSPDEGRSAKRSWLGRMRDKIPTVGQVKRALAKAMNKVVAGDGVFREKGPLGELHEKRMAQRRADAEVSRRKAELAGQEKELKLAIEAKEATGVEKSKQAARVRAARGKYRSAEDKIGRLAADEENADANAKKKAAAAQKAEAAAKIKKLNKAINEGRGDLKTAENTLKAAGEDCASAEKYARKKLKLDPSKIDRLYKELYPERKGSAPDASPEPPRKPEPVKTRPPAETPPEAAPPQGSRSLLGRLLDRIPTGPEIKRALGELFSRKAAPKTPAAGEKQSGSLRSKKRGFFSRLRDRLKGPEPIQDLHEKTLAEEKAAAQVAEKKAEIDRLKEILKTAEAKREKIKTAEENADPAANSVITDAAREAKAASEKEAATKVEQIRKTLKQAERDLAIAEETRNKAAKARDAAQERARKKLGKEEADEAYRKYRAVEDLLDKRADEARKLKDKQAKAAEAQRLKEAFKQAKKELNAAKDHSANAQTEEARKAAEEEIKSAEEKVKKLSKEATKARGEAEETRKAHEEAEKERARAEEEAKKQITDEKELERRLREAKERREPNNEENSSLNKKSKWEKFRRIALVALAILLIRQIWQWYKGKDGPSKNHTGENLDSTKDQKPGSEAGPSIPADGEGKRPQWAFNGTVYDLISLRPVPDATLQFVYKDGSTPARTDGSGAYSISLPALPEGAYSVAVTHADYPGGFIEEEPGKPIRALDDQQRKKLQNAGDVEHQWSVQDEQAVHKDIFLIPAPEDAKDAPEKKQENGQTGGSGGGGASGGAGGGGGGEGGKDGSGLKGSLPGGIGGGGGGGGGGEGGGGGGGGAGGGEGAGASPDGAAGGGPGAGGSSPGAAGRGGSPGGAAGEVPLRELPARPPFPSGPAGRSGPAPLRAADDAQGRDGGVHGSPYQLASLGSSFGPIPPELWPFTTRNPFPEGRIERPAARRPAREAGGAAASAVQDAAAAPAAAPPPQEEYASSYLGPAQHLISGRGRERQDPDNHKRDLIDLLLQLALLGALVYLWKFSDIPYLLGLSRKRR